MFKRILPGALACLLLAPGLASAQTRPGVPKKDKPAVGSVQISFLPPPLEDAVYALGVYESKTGRLVRRLHESAGDEVFTAGLNGLITHWDRKDDAGKTVPAGKYVARGWAVGEKLKVGGEGILGNEWVDHDENLRVRRVEAVCLVPDDEGLAVLATLADGSLELLRIAGGPGAELLWRSRLGKPGAAPPTPAGGWTLLAAGETLCVASQAGAAGGAPSRFVRLKDGAEEPGGALQIRVEGSAEPGTASSNLPSPGRDGSAWAVRDGKVTQSAADGTVTRSLDVEPGQPTPRAVSASAKVDRLYLLEEIPGWQRVRGLEWSETKQEGAQAISEWKTFFERSIRRPDPALGLEDMTTAKGSSPEVEITLRRNPLNAGKTVPKVKLRANFDEKGSYLEAVDGLRLRQVSERANLRAVRLAARGKEGGALAFYQTDGAAWDEFSITGARELMAFDAGDFELTATGEKRPEGPPAEPRDL